MFQDEGNNVTRDVYNRGYCLFAFDLTPDACDGANLNLLQKGNLRVEMHFGQPLQ